MHFFQLLVHLLADPSVIILCKSSSYPDDHQWFLQNAEACIIIFHILDDGFLMHSHSIHIPFCQKCIDQFPVSKTNQIAKFWNSLICPLQKDTFRFGCRLDCKILSFQITQFMNVTVLIYSNHLTACYVWSGPTIIVKSSFH